MPSSTKPTRNQKLSYWLIPLAIMAVCIYAVKLFIYGELSLYSHPRNHIFTLVLGLLGAIAAGYSLATKRREAKHEKKFGPFDKFIVLFFILMILTPPKPLSNSFVDKSSIVTPEPIENEYRGDECYEGSSSIETLFDRFSFDNYDCLEGKEVSVTGKYLGSLKDGGRNDVFYVGKLVLSCCVVDARMYSLPVEKGLDNGIEKNDWIEIKGKLGKKTMQGKEYVVIAPSSIKASSNPDQPYDFINQTSDQIQPYEESEIVN